MINDWWITKIDYILVKVYNKKKIVFKSKKSSPKEKKIFQQWLNSKYSVDEIIDKFLSLRFYLYTF